MPCKHQKARKTAGQQPLTQAHSFRDEDLTRRGRPPGTRTPNPRIKGAPGRQDCPNRDCNLNGVTPDKQGDIMTDMTNGANQGATGLSVADEQLLRELTERARAGGLKLTGEG